MNDKYKYKVSVIIPVYNVEDYLEETIVSVINQSLGFRKNIQMILVNDGSPDNSEEICLRYKEMYPDNVIYVKQENAGVSAARNNGLNFATGEYINFLDSDDKWSRDALKKGCQMLDNNPEIDLVFFRMKLFEASDKYHGLDYMFQHGDFVTDLKKDYQFIKLQCCSLLIRGNKISKDPFNTTLKISEDARFITELVLKNTKVGIIGSSDYYYRKRFAENSAIQNSTKKRTWYVDTPKLCYKYLFDLSKKTYGEVIPYVQFLVLYDLKWRLFGSIPIGAIDDKERKAYFKILGDLLREIDDKIIMEALAISDEKKLYMLSYKYEKNLNISLNKDRLLVNGLEFELDNFKIYFNNMIIKDNSVLLYCSIPNIKGLFDKIYIVDETGKHHLMKEYDLDNSTKKGIGINSDYAFTKKGLIYKVDLNKCSKFHFAIKSKNKFIKLGMWFTGSCPFAKKFASAYFKSNDYYLKYNKKNNYFYRINKSLFNGFKLELSCLYNLVKKRRIKVAIIRLLSHIYSKLNKEEIWIVSDRLNVAGENGEVFFDYLINNNKGPKHKYFVMSPLARDFSRLKKKYSKHLISSDSLRYKILFINSSKIISAQADDYVTNPFGNSKKLFRDMFKFKFIFLQHGVIKDDLSPWLNINSKTIDLFITTSKLEWQSIYDYNYNYGKDVVKVTGLARYDLLNNKEKEKTIVIMPTWRRALVGKIDQKTGLRLYDPKFKETEFFKFYNSLINDERLLSSLEETGYKLRFVLHNNMLQQIDDFDSNPFVSIIKDRVVYRDEFNKNALMVTDYSSVFFDFAYLKKPIVMAQFDSEEFFEGQIYDKGYFDYKKDGFGPVCDTYEETVNKIIEYIHNGCKIEEKYLKRIDKFFDYNDQKNCERIYKEIVKGE